MAHKEGDLGRKRPLMLNQSIAQLQARRLASGYVECLVDHFFLMHECARKYTEQLIWKTSGRERREYIKNWKQWMADREKTRHGYCNMTVRHVISGNSFAIRICVGEKDEAPTSWADIYKMVREKQNVPRSKSMWLWLDDQVPEPRNHIKASSYRSPSQEERRHIIVWGIKA